MGNVKVSIIPVELGESVPEIISDDLKALTQGNREQLEAIRQVAVASEAVRAANAAARDDKTTNSRAAKDTIQNILKDVADRILGAGEIGLPSEEVMELVRPLITTTSGFTLRMKTYLRSGGNQHIVMRVKDNYILRPYNATEEQEQPE